MTVGIYIDNPSRTLNGDRFFQQHIASIVRTIAVVRASLAAHGVPMHTADLLPEPNGSDTHLYVSINNYEGYRRLLGRKDVVRSLFMVTESPIVEPRLYRALKRVRPHFKRMMSCIDPAEFPDFGGEVVDCEPLRWPIDFSSVDLPLWSKTDRRFLSMVNMNKLPKVDDRELFTERMRAVEYFGRTGDIDLYGVGWDTASQRMGSTRVPWTLRRIQIAANKYIDRIRPDPLLVAARRVYKGPLDTKWETMSNYDFTLCFENVRARGWLTEKLFECLRVGTIPIYWGASDIEELVAPDCFIDMRQFSGYAELRTFLKSMDRRTVQQYRDAGRNFLESPGFRPFSKETVAGLFRDLLERDAGVRVPI
jgi:hypothetical protein